MLEGLETGAGGVKCDRGAGGGIGLGQSQLDVGLVDPNDVVNGAVGQPVHRDVGAAAAGIAHGVAGLEIVGENESDGIAAGGNGGGVEEVRIGQGIKGPDGLGGAHVVEIQLGIHDTTEADVHVHRVGKGAGGERHLAGISGGDRAVGVHRDHAGRERGTVRNNVIT